MSPTTLHPPESVFSVRHSLSWWMLTASAGAANAIAFMACEQFVAHLTGTIMRLGIEDSTWLLADYALIIVSFVAGAMASVVVIEGRHHRGKRPLHAVPLLWVATLIALVGFIGSSGFFGSFGEISERPSHYLFLGLLAFSMGLQNASVASSTGSIVRTTHLTGPATDLGVQLASAFYTRGERRRNAINHATLRAGNIIAFTIGAVVSVPLSARFGYLAFLFSSALVLVATALSFVPARVATAKSS